MREIRALIDGEGMQLITEAASLVDGCLGKLAGEMEARLVDPLNVRRRAISRLHHERIGKIFRGIEHQPAFRQETMRDHGQAGQQDADQQHHRVTGFFGP